MVKIFTELKTSTVFSNQPPPKIDHSVFTAFDVDDRNAVYVSRPFVDRIVLVGDVTVSMVALEAKDQVVDPGELLTQLMTNATVSLTKKGGRGFKPGPKVDKYNVGKKRLGSRNANALFGVSWSAKPDGFTRSLRLEFNPRRLGPNGLSELRAELGSLFFEDFELEWLARAKATRIDVAVDLVNIAVKDLIVRTSDGGKWSGYFGAGGRVETWSKLRAPTSKTLPGKPAPPILIVYNKRQELLDKNKEPKYGDAAHTRIERRLRASTRSFRTLRDISNPFADIRLGDVERLSQMHGAAWRCFADSALRRGVAEACTAVPKGKEELWKKALLEMDATFWCPDELWTSWSKSLTASGLGTLVDDARDFGGD